MGTTFRIVEFKQRLGEGWLARAWFSTGYGVSADVRLRSPSYAGTIFVSAEGRTRKLVGRPGLEPGTTGLKVRCSTN